MTIKGDIAQNEQFHLLYVFYATCILKSFNSHISVFVCSIFEFGMVSKSCIREWLKKTLREQEKLLVTSNFSFSLNVFHKCIWFEPRRVCTKKSQSLVLRTKEVALYMHNGNALSPFTTA